MWIMFGENLHPALSKVTILYQTKDFHAKGRVEFYFRQWCAGFIFTSSKWSKYIWYTWVPCYQAQVQKISGKGFTYHFSTVGQMEMTLEITYHFSNFRQMEMTLERKRTGKSFGQHSDRWNLILGDVVVFDQVELHEL